MHTRRSPNLQGCRLGGGRRGWAAEEWAGERVGGQDDKLGIAGRPQHRHCGPPTVGACQTPVKLLGALEFLWTRSFPVRAGVQISNQAPTQRGRTHPHPHSRRSRNKPIFLTDKGVCTAGGSQPQRRIAQDEEASKPQRGVRCPGGWLWGRRATIPNGGGGEPGAQSHAANGGRGGSLVAGEVREELVQFDALNADVGEPLWGRKALLND
jgi:hypothetical protein